jgi:glycosyltransferase involved in cell wall biosynthesis
MVETVSAMMNAPLVSVVMPSFQNAAYVATAIDSVLAQDVDGLELIVVDSSHDETPEILAGYGDRVRVLRTEPRGISAARNAGLALAQGTFVAFIDADDEWLHGKLQRQLAVLARDDRLGLVCTDVLFRDRHGIRPGRAFADATPRAGMIYTTIFSASFIGTLTVVARRDCLVDLGGFDESISAAEDHDLWLRLSRRWPIDFVDEPLAVYRYSDGQASADRERTLWGVRSRPDSGLIRVQERAYRSSPELQSLDGAVLDRCFFDLYLELAGLRVRSGRPAQAREALARYRSLRGITRRYVKLRVAAALPSAVVRRPPDGGGVETPHGR